MKKKILAMLLAVMMAVGLLPAAAFAADETSGKCGDNLTWSYSDGVLTLEGTGPMDDYVLYDVPWYSFRSNVHTVIIDDGITSIGDYAFYSCSSLNSVVIPDGVSSIGYLAFAYCNNLTSVTISDSVTSVSSNAFIGTLWWKNLGDFPTINGVLIGYEGNGAEVVIPDSVTSIGDAAFSDCDNLTSVVIPGSVTTIGDGAFADCSNLTSVTIPDGVTSIGDGAFADCSNLTSINVASGNSVYISVDGVLFNADQTILHAYPGGKSDLSYRIPDSVTTIGDSAFYGCTNLTDVTISYGVTSIGSSAFDECSSLTSVIIPDSVTSIAGRTFRYCSSLTSVTIPDSVTSIGDSAFYGCGHLTSVIIPEGVTAISNSTFSYCGLTSITIPVSVTSIGVRAFVACGNLRDVYYNGSKSQWDQIDIDNTDGLNYNAPLLKAAFHFAVTEPETPAITFTDVPKGVWYEKEVSAAVERGLIEGDNGKFNPDSKLTRASAFIILGRLAGADVEGGSPWYRKAVDWAVAEGISDGKNPNNDVTREQLAVMLWRYHGEPEADAATLAGYRGGSDVSSWAEDAMAWAVASGIIEGGDKGLDPQGAATRAQAVTMIMRYVDPDTFV